LVTEGEIAEGGGDLTIDVLFESTVLLEVESVTMGSAYADEIITKSTITTGNFLNIVVPF